jgi:hypothetical protein
MNFFGWMKRNRQIHWAALTSYIVVLWLSSVHSHPYFFINSRNRIETRWDESSSPARDCEKNDPNHSCALCDVIRLAGSGILFFSSEIPVWPAELAAIGFKSDTTLSGYHSGVFSRGPPIND